MFTSGISLPPFSVNICRGIYGRLAVGCKTFAIFKLNIAIVKNLLCVADRTIWDRAAVLSAPGGIYIYTLSLFAILIEFCYTTIKKKKGIENVTTSSKSRKRNCSKKNV